MPSPEEAVLRNAQMLQLQRPSKQVYRAFQARYNNDDLRTPYTMLGGSNEALYESRDDLISLRTT